MFFTLSGYTRLERLSIESMRKPYWVIVGVLILLIATLGAPGCIGSSLKKFEATRSMMDTFVTITVYSGDEKVAEEAISAAFARMEEVERVASIFDEESEAFQLNQDGYLEAPSDDLLELITMSLDYNQLTDGYFDITVQPLLELWQAGLWQESKVIQKIRIQETQGCVGSDKISIEDNRISFGVEGMKITLGGIAKGYAVDEALEVMGEMGIKHALVNAGGDMSMLGSKPKDEPWLVALVNPDDTSQSLANFSIFDKAIATSGNYERYFDLSKEVHHIINPKTGYSAEGCISVTVIADGAARADALATSIFAMGHEDGIELIESLADAECLIVDADRTNIYVSSGLSMYLVED
jgi:thiamine biosynthesis lipoprotein